MGRHVTDGALMTQDDAALILFERGILPKPDRRAVQYSEKTAFAKIRAADPTLFEDYLDLRGRAPGLPPGILAIW